MDMTDKLAERLGKDKLKTNVRLATFTTIKVGGPAKYFFEASSEQELIDSVLAAKTCDIPYLVIGGGSNLLIADKGFDGLVIVNRTHDLTIISETAQSVLVRVSSGYPTSLMAKRATSSGWDDFVWYCGLPGSIGGAIYMNSKWGSPTKYISDHLVRTTLIDRDGQIKKVVNDYFDFAYDFSRIQKTKEIIINADFQFRKTDPKILLEQEKQVMDYRLRTQPHGVFSSGCFFKNIDGRSVGQLIDEAGMKGYKIGGAQVSENHANFIINDGKATYQDIYMLQDKIRSVIKEKYDVNLDNEVVLI